MKSNLLEIIKFYGIIPQLKYFQSEVFEFNEAVINYCNGNIETKNKESIIEEIADMMVMIKQFQEIFEIETDDILKIMQYKIHRQLKRIEKESEDKK